MSFLSESFSRGFGVDGVTIEQTLLNPYDPYSGMDIITSSFQNTNQGLLDSNQDGRIELGMFSFNDDNFASDNFPDITSVPFIGMTKTNLVKNGDCKFIEKNLLSYTYEDQTNDNQETTRVFFVQPENNWRFLSLYDSSTLDFSNSDEQGFLPYGGKCNYIPLSLEIDGSTGFNYWGNFEEWANYDGTGISGGVLSFLERFQGSTLTQQGIFDDLEDDGSIGTDWAAPFPPVYITSPYSPAPHIASWIVSDEAYSNNRCLCFMNFWIWDKAYQQQFAYTNGNNQIGKHIWNWFYEDDVHLNGELQENFPSLDEIKEENNQYRVLNQVQKIYDKFNDEIINPYSSLKIRFKMKTTLVFPPGNTISDADESELFFQNPLDEDLGYAPQVEVGVLPSQWNETPKTGVNSLPNYFSNSDLELLPSGKFNSNRYFNGDTYEDKRYSPNGGQNRFQNSIMNEWETFEFNFNLTEDHLNRKEIYGVPYGGTFGEQGDDDKNQGEVEIMINHHGTLPNYNSGEIYFKVPGYESADTRIDGDKFYMTSPSGVEVTVRHGDVGHPDYMTVVSELGEGTSTGLQSDGRFIEAYLMYVGGLNLEMTSTVGYGLTDDGGSPTDPTTDMVVAYWNGERWSYDNDLGYDIGREFTPNSDCFIIARLYADDGGDEDTEGITGIEQYIDNESEFPTGGLGNLHLFLQSGNNFRGRVLIDDIECFESYEFIPEVDVRKKLSVGKYGSADLTKYYDKKLEPKKYKDTTGPLEAQFYFYPQYPTNETFVERLPIYQDFKEGRFYIYDVNWGDGTPNEFTSEPEQIDEEKALYHTYETNGVFEVTGLMMRVKVNNKGKIQGVAHNKKFKLRINVNPGLDEDFQYFGSDGYSFIPYKNTVPIIGGISKQSNYYKSIKRQLGFLNKIETDENTQDEELRNIEDFINNDYEPLPDDYTPEDVNQQIETLSNLPFPKYIEEFDINQNGFIDDNFSNDFTEDELLWYGKVVYVDDPAAGRPDIRTLLFELRTGIVSNAPNYIYPDYVNEWSSISDIKYNTIPRPKISIEFKNKSDKLKTELALLKMENQSNSNLEVLPSYMIPRIVFGDSIPSYLLYMGTISNPNPLFDTYNTLEWPGPDFNLFDNNDEPNFPAAPAEGIYSILDYGNNMSTLYQEGVGFIGTLQTLVTGNTYTFNVNVDEFYWDAIQSLANPYNLFNNQTLVWPVQDLEINADNIPSVVIRIERSDGAAAAWAFDQNEYQWVGNLLNDGLETGKTYSFMLIGGNTDIPEDDVEGIYWPILPDTYVEPDKIIYNGISPIKEELGKGIGDCDLTNVKYYNKPKSIWELFGFEGTLNEQDTEDIEETIGEDFIPGTIVEFFNPSYFNTSIDGLVVKSTHDGTATYYEGYGWFGNLLTEDVDFSPYQNEIEEYPPPPNNEENQKSIQILNESATSKQFTHPELVTLYWFEQSIESQTWSDMKSGISLNIPPQSRIEIIIPVTTAPAPIEDSIIENTENDFGVPIHPRYWKNIIPQNYSIFNREGVSDEFIDISSQQDWLPDENENIPYYPVLPKYGLDGRFLEVKTDDNGNALPHTYPNNKILFPLNGPITDENESDENLLINIINEKNDVEVFNDKSGNKNYGLSIQDFNPKFDEKTLRVEKNKSKSIFKTSKQNGAF